MMDINFNLELKKAIIGMHNKGMKPMTIIHNLDSAKWDMNLINRQRIVKTIQHAKKYKYLGEVR